MLGTNFKWVVRNGLVERVTFDTSPVGSEADNPGDICEREVRESRWKVSPETLRQQQVCNIQKTVKA